MSSLIPKIRIGRDTGRNKFDISCMTHTTSEIGYVQPTFGRTIVPNSKVRIGTRTGSRLSPLYVPTMGKIDIRHYHCFVPYSTIWTPFDSFLTKQNYTLPTGETYLPSSVPHFTFKDFFRRLFDYGFSTGYMPVLDLTGAFVGGSGKLFTDAEYRALQANNKFLDIFGNAHLGIFPRLWISEEGHIWLTQNHASSPRFTIEPLFVDGVDTAPAVAARKRLAFPSARNFDFMDYSTDNNNVGYKIAFNFNGALKRLRSIFIGLGYSFNPFDDTSVTPLKLLSFYKAYYALFGVNRERNFYNTYCYKLIKYLSENIVTDMSDYQTHPMVINLFVNFLRLELANCTYTCPVDYFSAADTTTQRGAGEGITVESSITGMSSPFGDPTLGASSSPAFPTSVNNLPTGNSQAAYALSQQIALRLLRFVNKNSVIGRKISDILRTRYGVTDLHNDTHESIIRVGASSTDIEISAIYSNTETEDIPLGGYAGAGMSSRANANSKTFTFETKEFGVLVTLTAVVPKMGYFQGMLRENSDGVNDFSEFFVPEFDGLGWQAVRYNELVADRMICRSSSDSSKATTSLGVWGYLPRMSHYKVGFNRVMGDISLPHMQDSMLPYTLDRFFKNRDIDANGNVYPTSLPVNEAQSFRSGTQGETNRIFTDMSPTDDHVILQIFFDVKMSAPMKSIATSFDTWDEESKQSVEVAHE